MLTRHGTNKTGHGPACDCKSPTKRAVSESPTTPSARRAASYTRPTPGVLPGHLCPRCSAGLAARQRPPRSLHLTCPPPLHAEAPARGPPSNYDCSDQPEPAAAPAAVRAGGGGGQRGRKPVASARRLPGQRQRQTPSSAAQPPPRGIQAE